MTGSRPRRGLAVAFATLGLGVGGLVGCDGGPAAEPQPPQPTVAAATAPTADKIWRGGPVLTVDAEDRVVDAVAARDGRILAVGADVAATEGPETEIVDLGGKALLPGFIDGHGHLAQVALLAAAVNIAPPPVGDVESIAEIQAALRERIESEAIAPGTWVLGTGYDDSLLAEQRHPTRDELDAVSTEHPIVLAHVSLHLAAANSVALAEAGITAGTADPPGGVIRRRTGTQEPDGVLEEHAMWLVLGSVPPPTLEQRLDLLDQAQARYAELGITTAQEGALGVPQWEMLRAAADAGRLRIDVGAYPTWRDYDTIADGSVEPGVYDGRLKLAGVKLVLDGSPQGKTAWLTQPYHVPPPGQGADYVGYPAMPDAEVEEWVEGFTARGIPMLAHANGDAAADQLIRAVEKAQAAHGGDDRRTVMIHAQTVRADQLDRMAELGMIPSFFVTHTFFWGDWHRDSVLGPERAANISPTAWARDRGLRFTVHNDPPVAPPDGVLLLWSAVNRATRSGEILGPEQRIPPAEALRALTIDGAHQYFEEATKGSIEPGKLADFVILDGNPLEVEPLAIRDLKVVETIKEGETIFP